MKKEFPGKAISYALIQDDFPLVNDSGGWETADGKSSNGKPLPQGTEQTERIIEIGQSELGPLWVVQHNGLQVPNAEHVRYFNAGRSRSGVQESDRELRRRVHGAL